MALISKSFHFEAAHHLEGHKGKCARPHGHSYVLEVRLQGPIKPAGRFNYPYESDAGMVLDFDEISAAVAPMLEHLDHFDLNERMPIIGRPTAEMIACWMFGYLRRAELQVHSVVLHETASSYVQVFESDWKDSGL